MVAPHADDEVLGAGGTIARHIGQGDEVHVCIVTVGHPSMYPQELLDEIRRETMAAHEYLGVTNTIFLELPAVMLNQIPVPELNKRVYDVIDELRPTVVLIPHFGDMHLDHGIVSRSVMVGVRPINGHRVLEVYSYETLSETEWNIPHSRNAFMPNTFVDISDYLETKIEAMRCIRTQLRSFPHPRSLEAIESLARLRGSTIGVDAAEAFCLIRRIEL